MIERVTFPFFRYLYEEVDMYDIVVEGISRRSVVVAWKKIISSGEVMVGI